MPIARRRPRPTRIAFIGAGPAALMLLERIVANHDAEHSGLPLHIDLVDPHAPGGGRIWRRDQSAFLKLNTLVGDAAVFTDESCVIEGPIRPGPSLDAWIDLLLEGRVERPDWWDDALEREIHAIDEHAFPTRRLNNAYLDWAYGEVLRRAHSRVTVTWRPERAVRVDGACDEGAAVVVLESGETFESDIVVNLLGHNGAEPAGESARLGDFAARHDLVYLPPAFTAEADLSDVRAGSDVIVRGMGLAAVDLVVLLTEGRGGRYERVDGRLRYVPSGDEPVLHLGSRRGVPYRSKITSRLAGDPARLEYVGEAFRERIAGTVGVDFDREALPLFIAECLTGFYRELATAHADRVRGDWTTFSRELRQVLSQPDGWRSQALRALVERRVPDPEDRLDFEAFDRPLEHAPIGAAASAGSGGAAGGDASDAPDARGDFAGTDSADDVHRRVLSHIAQDLAHRTEQRRSATQGLFTAALFAFMSLADVPGETWSSGTEGERRLGVSAFASASFSGLFSYIASGPPGHRLEELQALAEAGVVRFLGGNLELEAQDPGQARGAGGADARFVATGRARTARGEARATVRSDTLIDAWLPEADVTTSDNQALRHLVAESRRREAAGGPAAVSNGQLLVTDEGRLPGLRRRFAAGAFTTVFTGAFTRPGINASSFRRLDRLARAILADADELAEPRGKRRQRARGPGRIRRSRTANERRPIA